MTYKDCVHFESCKNLYETHGEGLSGDSYVCDFFKDRARFVELPCMVGDTVYMLTEQTQKLGRKKITKAVIIECCVDNFRIGDAGYTSAALCDNKNVWRYGVEPKMFGEIIFLSREAAEQALKERE